MTRRLLNFPSVLSLLICVAVGALWARSYARSQFVGWSAPDRFFGALSMTGLVRLEYGTYPGDGPGWSYVSYPAVGGGLWGEAEARGLWGEVVARDRGGGWLKRLGIAYARVDYRYDGTQVRRAIYLPHWLLACPTLVVPAWRIRRALQSGRRTAAGLCASCGYDLRATPGRCPECGATDAERNGGACASSTRSSMPAAQRMSDTIQKVPATRSSLRGA